MTASSRDISDILLPIKARFAPNTLETTNLYNDRARRRPITHFP
jgi:multiple sugar transport system substrate-binding protein